jgi:lysophospholipase L1-like esterase
MLPQPVRVVNLGIPGIRLREASIVETGPALESKPNLITIWLVVNDILNSVSLDAYRADIDSLLLRLKSESSAEIAVGNVPDAPDGSGYLGLPDGPRREVATRWNGVIGDAVARHGVTLIDLWSRWPVRANPKFIGPDGLHPTVAGYRSLAQVVRDTLRDALIV